MTAKHENQRIRHPLAFRRLEVLRVVRLTPRMVRVTFGGDELRGFMSAAADDHVKLFFPLPGHGLVLPTPGVDGLVYPEGVTPSPMRDYTPRRYDGEMNELDVDFVIHGDGPASTWAEQAAPGQRLGAGGPKGSFVIANDFDTYVMVGDETALPAIGRWLEMLPDGVRAEVIVEVADRGEQQVLTSRAQFNLTWLHRDSAAPGTTDALEQAVRHLPLPPGDSFYWIAAESRQARAIRLHLIGERGVDKDWVKATGYWKLDGDEEE
jgi:NADPH-dependent ferric siderophore reductase